MTENEIAKIIVDAAYKVHVALGPGLLESVYEVSPPGSMGPTISGIAGDRFPSLWQRAGIDPFRTSLRDPPAPALRWS